MEQMIRCLFRKVALSVAGALLVHSALAQGAPELVFGNPVLEQGVAGEDGAVYRFTNIAAGVDGLLEIKKRSHETVVLEAIDVAGVGWEKALQPRLGMSGTAAGNQVWWMQFELAFVQRNSTRKKALPHFAATPLDVDGDNVALREFVQMDGATGVTYALHTALKNATALPQHPSGATDNALVGPVASFDGMDTAATAVMATYTYENTDAITFTIGAASQSGTGGVRLNSIWFKPFNLEPQPMLPVAVETFAATYTGKAIKLQWKTTDERHFSHFVVERSVNGRTYTAVAQLQAKGSTSGNAYSYKDKVVVMPAGMAYYRLRLVDENRLASYTAVSTVFARGLEHKNKIAVGSQAARSNGSLPLAWKTK